MPRQILVTSAPALRQRGHPPRPPGRIHPDRHLGALPEDAGHQCWYVCADDTHGTPIMLRAEKDGITPRQLDRPGPRRTFPRLCRLPRRLRQLLFDPFRRNPPLFRQRHLRKLKAAGLIEPAPSSSSTTRSRQMFLPDRFIKGECPKCGRQGPVRRQLRGSCGAAYPQRTEEPYSAVSGAKPELRQSEHYFFKLSDPRCQDFLRRYHPRQTAACRTRKPPTRCRNGWDEPGRKQAHRLGHLRDAPTSASEIPDAPGKYFYVWLDAPIGYIGSFKNLVARQAAEGSPSISTTSDARRAGAELYHFIGKDILYFHALFWPARLAHAGYRTPTRIFAHGFLTVDGAKMSKSAAPSSPPRATSTPDSTRNGCATTTPPNCRRPWRTSTSTSRTSSPA